MPGTFSGVRNIFNSHDWWWGEGKRTPIASSGKDAFKHPTIHRRVAHDKEHNLAQNVNSVEVEKPDIRVCSS